MTGTLFPLSPYPSVQGRLPGGAWDPMVRRPFLVAVLTLAVGAAAPTQAQLDDREWTVEAHLDAGGRNATLQLHVDCSRDGEANPCSADVDSDPGPPSLHEEETITYEGNSMDVTLDLDCSGWSEDGFCTVSASTDPDPLTWVGEVLKDVCIDLICVR